jgi:hypothetical protein
MLDPQIGRWHVIDPLSHKTPLWSPYNYVGNNPLLFVDPNGMERNAYGDDPDELVKNGQAVRVQGADLLVNKATGSILNREGGSAGVKFKSADEAAEGLIHTHPTQNDFSKHVSVEDVNQILDEDVWVKEEYSSIDWYLVNPIGELR